MRCNIFQYLAAYGDETKELTLFQPSGSSGSYQIIEGTMYLGQAVYQMGTWNVYFNRTTLEETEIADRMAIEDFLNENHQW